MEFLGNVRKRVLPFRPQIALFLLACFALILAGCAKQEDGQAPILRVRGEEAYMADLELLAVLAGYRLDQEADQQRFQENAPNFYETLIDFYVMKYAAIDEGLVPSPEELEEQFSQMKERLQERGYYQQMLQGLGVSEEEFKETLRYQIAVQRLQSEKLSEAGAEPTDEEIEQHYQQNRQEYRHPNRIRASHIFLAVPPDATTQVIDQAKRRAQEIRRMIGDQPTQTFAGLAQSYSQDGATNQRGGDIGFFDRDNPEINEAFKKAAFSLPLGAVSDVVRSPNGFHIIWVTDHEQSLDEAREQIRREMVSQAREIHFKRWLAQKKASMEIERLFAPQEFRIKDEAELAAAS